jgi:hypothetical protein
MTYLVVPFEDVDSLAFDEVHGLASLGDEGGQGVEHIPLLDVQNGKASFWRE